MENNAYILVVDDEEIERRMISCMLRHELHHSYKILEASTGVDAVDLAEKYNPGIIIMDICMPLMNGLEALKEIKKTHSDVDTIILTAHDEFEYAVQAVKLGVGDYLLKPVRVPKLLEAIQQVEQKRDDTRYHEHYDWKQKMDYFTPYIEDSIISAIVMESYDERKLQSLIRQILGEGSLAMMVLDNRRLDFQVQQAFDRAKQYFDRKKLPQIGSCIGSQIIFLVQLPETELPAITEALQGVMPRDTALRFAALHEPLRAALEYRKLCFPSGEREPERFSSTFLCHEKDIAIKIATQEEEAARMLIERLLVQQSAAATKQNPLGVRMEARRAIIDHYIEMTVGTIHLSPVVSFEIYTDFVQLKNAAAAYVHQRILNVEESQAHRMPDFIHAVIGDMEKNFPDGRYSLSKAADNLKISATYLSKIFKEQLGSTFTQYLNDIRIDEAKKKLHSHADIADIARSCGFNSPNYFCKVFKKYVGISATDYRDNKISAQE